MKKSLIPILALAIAPLIYAEEGRHALIIGIGNYSTASKTPALAGVAKDILNARRMAAAMGVESQNITELRDSTATKKQILLELDRLQQKTQSGDRVLIYYSGHGTRFSSENRCVEGLQTYTEGPFTVSDVLSDSDLARYTRPISEKADKVITMIDACFSGGVMTSGSRSVLGQNLQIRAKFNDNPNQRCDMPVNNKRSLLTEVKRLGVRDENFVQIAAAKNNEVSWDNPELGGLATHAMTQCLLGEAKDINESGAVSLDEVRACAQIRLNAMMRPFESRGMLPSTIQVRGNRNLILTPVVYAAAPAKSVAQLDAPGPESRPPAASRPQNQAVLPLPITKPPKPETVPQAPTQIQVLPVQTTLPNKVEIAPQPVAIAVPAPVLNSAQAFDVPPSAVAFASFPPSLVEPVQIVLGSRATLDDLMAQGNPKTSLKVTAPKTLVINKDKLTFKVKSSRAGYLYVVMLGSDEKSFYLLFPNKLDQDNSVKANQSYDFPRIGWQLTAGGPVGTDKVLFVVSDSPRDSKIFVPVDSGGGAFTYSVADETSRKRLIDFFLGKGVKGGTPQMSTAIISIEEKL